MIRSQHVFVREDHPNVIRSESLHDWQLPMQSYWLPHECASVIKYYKVYMSTLFVLVFKLLSSDG